MIDGEMVLWKGHFTRVDIASVRSKIDVAVEDLASLSNAAQQPYPVHAMAATAYQQQD